MGTVQSRFRCLMSVPDAGDDNFSHKMSLPTDRSMLPIVGDPFVDRKIRRNSTSGRAIKVAAQLKAVGGMCMVV